MQKDTRSHPAGPVTPPGYESRDVNVRLFAAFITGVSVLTIVTLLIIWGFTEFMSSRERKSQPPVSPLAGQLPQEPPEPRLQVRPKVDLQRESESEEEVLNSYAWIDRKGGIVRIPVERAMDLLLERGLPTRGPAAVVSGTMPQEKESERKR